MQAEIIDLVHMFINKAERLNFRCGDFPAIRFDLKGARAGEAICYGHDNIVRFNIPLLTRGGSEAVYNTVGHEVAHIVANRHFGKSCGHKREWRYVMQRLGLKAERCHTIDVTGLIRTQKRLEIVCACGVQLKLSQTIVNKIKRGEHRICNNCKTRVVLNANQ